MNKTKNDKIYTEFANLMVNWNWAVKEAITLGKDTTMIEQLYDTNKTAAHGFLTCALIVLPQDTAEKCCQMYNTMTKQMRRAIHIYVDRSSRERSGFCEKRSCLF